MAVTVTQVEDRVVALRPRFCTRAWETMIPILAELAVAAHMDSDDWESDVVYTNAMAYWVLHELMLAEQEDASPTMAGASGPVGSIRTMDESVSFISPSVQHGPTSDAYFKRTTAGKRYLMLRQTRPDAHSFVI